MSLYYASIGYTTEPGREQIIPAGATRPLKFPRNEQRDPWDMHASPGMTATIRIPADGIAAFQLDVYWATGATHTSRYNIVGDQQDYEGTLVGTGEQATWTHRARVRQGEEIAVLISHDAATGQEITAARLQVAVEADVALPPERRQRVRTGTDPFAPTSPPGQDPTVGDGIPQGPSPDSDPNR